MRKQWTATALVMALGLAAPVLAQDDPTPRQTDPSTQPDDGMPRDTPAPMPPPAETPAPVDESTSAEREPAVQATSGEEYVVQKGDTLSGLAERFLGSAGQWKQIADANALQNPDMISVGQKLQMPQGSNEAAPASRPQDDEATPDQAQ